MFVVAAALLGLIALLATLQYRWLGQVSAAERERMKTNLASRAAAFAQEFDRELTRAYLTFQIDPAPQGQNLAARVAGRHELWTASRYPKIVKEVYLVPRTAAGELTLQRYNPAAQTIEPAEWPAALEPIRAQLARAPEVLPAAPGTTVFVASVTRTVWDAIPALVVPTPALLLNLTTPLARQPSGARLEPEIVPVPAFTILALDGAYISRELLPQLARQHFTGTTEGIDYELAVVSGSTKEALYTSTPAFAPDPAAPSDAAADMFQVRLQEFGTMGTEVRRLTSFVSRMDSTRGSSEVRMAVPSGTITGRTTRITGQSPPISILLERGSGPSDRNALEAGMATAAARAAEAAPRWRLVVKHPAGSLETAVASVRRRNLLVSSGILAILGVSIGFLVASTRRAQGLARQQMEFVAAVSHELRTPLAVIRSAADNLADGVVHEDPQVKKYGALVRGEGRRLTEMVEQILELAGIQSGQRGFALGPVHIQPLLRQVVQASATLIEQAGMTVDYDMPDTLPPALGDEPGLRRVFQNLVGNAIKYGASGGWIGLRARATGRELQVIVSDRGMGIDPSQQEKIFEPFYRTPDVIDAQLHGAGLGLSLVRRIVEAHGGRITLRSAPGGGSDFTVHLPAASGEAVAQGSAAQDPARTSA